jgi:hypothetical protein
VSKKKNEEKSKSYVEVIKRRNNGQQESKKNNRDTYSTRPTTFRKQRRFNDDKEIHKREYHDQTRNKLRRTTQQRRSFTLGTQIYFMFIVFIVLTLDIRLQIARLMK